MRYILIILILIFTMTSTCYADWAVMIDKATGRILMSHKDPNSDIYKQLMKKDALSSQIDLSTIEIKIISDEEYATIFYNTVIKPLQDKRAQEELVKKQIIEEVKLKLNLSEEYWQKLKEALK